MSPSSAIGSNSEAHLFQKLPPTQETSLILSSRQNTILEEPAASLREHQADAPPTMRSISALLLVLAVAVSAIPPPSLENTWMIYNPMAGHVWAIPGGGGSVTKPLPDSPKAQPKRAPGGGSGEAKREPGSTTEKPPAAGHAHEKDQSPPRKKGSKSRISDPWIPKRVWKWI